MSKEIKVNLKPVKIVEVSLTGNRIHKNVCVINVIKIIEK